jgi:hypothetical protein
VAGSSDSDEVWLNWIVRRRSDTQPIGTVQATLTTRDGQSTATVASVIGVDWQNQRFASEGAQALIKWLWQHGANEVIACIHPDDLASTVGRNASRVPTDRRATRWRPGVASIHGPDRAAPDRGGGAPLNSSAGSISATFTG